MRLEDFNMSFFNGVAIGTVLAHIFYSDYIIGRLYMLKILKVEKKIDELEEFRILMYERNLILDEKRQWDEEISDVSETSDHSSLVEEM